LLDLSKDESWNTTRVNSADGQKYIAKVEVLKKEYPTGLGNGGMGLE